MLGLIKDLSNRLRIQRRAIGSYAFYRQVAIVQQPLETPEKPRYILISGVIIENLIVETLELVVVHNEQHTERAII